MLPASCRSSGAFATAVTNRKAARGFDLTADFARIDFDVENLDFGKIQLLFGWNVYEFALPDDCGLVTTTFGGISRTLTKNQNFVAPHS